MPGAKNLPDQSLGQDAIHARVGALPASTADIEAVLREAYFSDDCHEREVIELLPKMLGRSKIVVDIGASLGQYTFHAGKHVRRGRILALEPDPVRFALLRDNCLEWERQSTNRISAVHAAVGDRDGETVFFATDTSMSGGLFAHPGADGATPQWHEIAVQCITLDSLFPEESPDFVKIDVEGAELRVLKGATRILKQGDARFLVELHPWVDPGGQGSPREVVDFMRSFGYRPLLDLSGRVLFVKWPKARLEFKGILMKAADRFGGLLELYQAALQGVPPSLLALRTLRPSSMLGRFVRRIIFGKFGRNKGSQP